MKCQIIFRSHSGGDIHPGNRVVGVDKTEIILCCLRSLVTSINEVEKDIELVVVDDHSSSECLGGIKKILEKCKFPTEILNMEKTGNSESLRASYELARSSSSPLIYFVEDDYLHFPYAISEMIEAHQDFSKNIGREVAIFPVDYPDRYTPQGIYQSMLIRGKNRHFRTVRHSTCTFMISRSAILSNWHIFENIGNLNSNFINEDETVNNLWKNTTLFSPIPSLAIHLQGKEILPPFIGWQKLWEDNK